MFSLVNAKRSESREGTNAALIGTRCHIRLAGTFTAFVLFVPATVVFGTDFTEVCSRFGASDAVFIGRAEPAVTRRISFEAPAKSQPTELVVTPLQVEHAFRGNPAAQMFLWTDGLTLEPGQAYLVFGQLDVLAPDIVTGFPLELDSAEDELRFLQAMIEDRRGAVLSGSLMLQDLRNTADRKPLAGVPLRVSSGDVIVELVTSVNGTFGVAGLPVGLARVEVDLPAQFRLDFTDTNTAQVRMPEAGCPALNLTAILNGQLSGRIALHDGLRFRGRVSLIPADASSSIRRSISSGHPDGTFTFTGVPPGTYLIGVNVDRQPSAAAPYPPTYYPGVTERDLATLIVVGEATRQTDIEWTLGERLPQGEILVVLDTSGRPQRSWRICIRELMGADGEYVSEYAKDLDDLDRLPPLIPVFVGMRYQIAAIAQTSRGYEYSRTIDLSGTTERRVINLPVAGASDVPPGDFCTRQPQ